MPDVLAHPDHARPLDVGLLHAEKAGERDQVDRAVHRPVEKIAAALLERRKEHQRIRVAHDALRHPGDRSLHGTRVERTARLDRIEHSEILSSAWTRASRAGASSFSTSTRSTCATRRVPGSGPAGSCVPDAGATGAS
jgi:hypothetical protein